MKQAAKISMLGAASPVQRTTSGECETTHSLHRDLVVATAQVSPENGKNQDRIFAFTSLIPSAGSSVSIALLAVADGVGGMEHSGLASDIAISTTSEFVLRHVILPSVMIDGISCQHGTIREVLKNAIREANHQVFSAGAERNTRICTTLTALLIVGSSGHLVHAGDSRAYAIEASGIRQLTTDHSIGARLVDIGQEVPGSGGRGILYRALGAAPEVEPQVTSFQLNGTIGFILCSDGLWSASGDSVFQEAAIGPARARTVCNHLLAAASKRLVDDASAIVAMFEQV